MKTLLTLLAFLSLFFWQPTFAGTPTPSEIASAAEIIAAANTPKASTARMVNEWVDVGKNIGSSLGSAARESGAIVNDFVKTPAGTVIAIIIAYHYVGHQIICLSAAIFMWAFVLPWLLRALYVAYKQGRISSCKFEHRPVLWGLYQRKEMTEVEYNDDLPEAAQVITAIYSIASAVVFTAGAICLGNT